MGMGGGRMRGVGVRDEELQRELNATAPRVRGLLGRVGGLFKPYRGRLIMIGTLVIVTASLTVVPPLLTQRAFDFGLFPTDGSGPNIPTLLGIVGLMVLVLLIADGLGVWQNYLTATVGNRVTGALRVQLFSHLQRMELAFFTRTRTGVIQSRLANDVGGVAGVLSNTVSSVIGNTVNVIAALSAMLILSPQLTLIAVVVTPILVLVQRRVGQIRARIATRTQESLSEMTAITQEALSVSGVLLAKSFSRQDDEVARYAAENEKQVYWQVRQSMSGQWFFALVGVFLALIPAIIYVFSAWMITGGADITAGTIVAFTTVQSRLMMPLLGLMRVALDLQTSGALFARIFEYLDLKPAITDKPDAIALPADAEARIEFEDVTFRYPDAEDEDRPTLDHLNFTIEPGQFAAFVGPSGSGKTTVSYLIPRLYDAASGSVRFGGYDVEDVQHSSLMDRMGIVSQESYLFHASIAENLRYAKPDATDEDLEAACRAANIHATIASFPDGYNTVVGERGYRLSGGEKQRVAIARVLLKNPQVLILDEATSALDTISERIVQEAIDSASAGRTVVAIAHRLSTILGADVIFVLDQGRIVEQGTHEELLELGGRYAELYAQQHEGD